MSPRTVAEIVEKEVWEAEGSWVTHVNADPEDNPHALPPRYRTPGRNVILDAYGASRDPMLARDTDPLRAKVAACAPEALAVLFDLWNHGCDGGIEIHAKSDRMQRIIAILNKAGIETP